MPPYTLRQRGASNVSDCAYKGRRGSRLRIDEAGGRDRRCEPEREYAFAPCRLVTDTVDRPQRVTLGRRMPADVGARCDMKSLTLAQTLAPGLPRAPHSDP